MMGTYDNTGAVEFLDSGAKRCQANTKSGVQCKKAAQDGSDYCGQHTPAVSIADPRSTESVPGESNPNTGKGTTRIRINRGDVLVNTTPKRAERKARKRAKAERRFAHNRSKDLGAVLAKARAKQARAERRAAAKAAAK